MKNTPPGQTVTSDDATNGSLAAVSPADHMAPMTGRFTAQAAAIVPDRCAGVVADGPGRGDGQGRAPRTGARHGCASTSASHQGQRDLHTAQ